MTHEESSSTSINMEARINYLFFIGCAVGPLSLLGSTLTLTTLYRENSTIERRRKRRRNASPPRRLSSLHSSQQQPMESASPPSPPQHQLQERQPSSPAAASTTTRRRRTTTTYQRLLMGISVGDILLSIACTLGPLPMPSEMSAFGIPGAHGNTATCTIQGFLLQLGSSSFGYSCMLMFMYVLVIVFNVSDQLLQKRVEPFMHALPILFFGGTAVSGLFLKVFNPAGNFCWVGVYPPGCDEVDELECSRGGNPNGATTETFGLYFLTVPIVVLTFGLVLCLILVAWTVWYRHFKSRRYDMTSSYVMNHWTNRKSAASARHESAGTATATPRRINDDGTSSNNSNGGRSSQSSQGSNRDRTRQVIVQCLLYGVTFVNMLVWGTMGTLFFVAGRPYDALGRHFWISALSVTFFPLQGLFNFLIFIRPRYLRKRLVHGNRSRPYALFQAVWNVSSSSTSSHRSRHNSIVLQRARQQLQQERQQRQPQGEARVSVPPQHKIYNTNGSGSTSVATSIEPVFSAPNGTGFSRHTTTAEAGHRDDNNASSSFSASSKTTTSAPATSVVRFSDERTPADNRKAQAQERFR